MPGAINDLARFTDYAATLGNAATPADVLSASMEVGLAWRDMRDETALWDTYVKAQDGLAWKAATTMLEEVKPLILYAMAKNPTLATTYPSLAELFDAGKVIAKTSTATKAKNAKAKKAATEAATARAASSSTAGTTSSATAATPALGVTSAPKVTITT